MKAAHRAAPAVLAGRCIGRAAGQGARQAESVCQRCHSGEVDDEEHMVFRCTALIMQRLQHASLFHPWPDSLRSFMAGDPTELAAFAHHCCEEAKKLHT